MRGGRGRGRGSRVDRISGGFRNDQTDVEIFRGRLSFVAAVLIGGAVFQFCRGQSFKHLNKPPHTMLMQRGEQTIRHVH